MVSLLKNGLTATLLKKGLTATLLKKGLTENPKNCLSLITLSLNPIGVINRRNGCSTTLLKKGLTEKALKMAWPRVATQTFSKKI